MWTREQEARNGESIQWWRHVCILPCKQEEVTRIRTTSPYPYCVRTLYINVSAWHGHGSNWPGPIGQPAPTKFSTTWLLWLLTSLRLLNPRPRQSIAAANPCFSTGSPTHGHPCLSMTSPSFSSSVTASLLDSKNHTARKQRRERRKVTDTGLVGSSLSSSHLSRVSLSPQLRRRVRGG